MNARCFKTVFSKRLHCLVAVGEHASSQGKACGGGGGSLGWSWRGFIGLLTGGFAAVSLAWAQPAATALPTGGVVAQGAVGISQSGANMNIAQGSAKAVVNWQSFDIGKDARVNIQQPGADSVILNRVTGANPSQIFGQLNANGQVVLVNPSGVLFGRDGSVTATSFTASTLGISDANFMAGRMQFERNGSTAGVVNQGSIQTGGGYVALLGASVSNEGRIETQGGTAYLAAAEAVRIPVSGSGRIKLELSPAQINARVANAKEGTIVTQGGQVYMQAAALQDAVASIVQSGRIDTTGAQGGAVHVLADGGQIRVDGSITTNSSTNGAQAAAGGDIYIGRDKETGALAKATDASGAVLESQGGFVETSGDLLKTDGIRVRAAEWLLDPTNITISGGPVSGDTYNTNYAPGTDSVILASDVQASLNAGTSVTLATTGAGASAGDITVASAITKNAGGNATLTLRAHNNILVNSGAGITSTTGQLNIVFNSDLDGDSAGGIRIAAPISTNGGSITLGGGTAGMGTGFAFGFGPDVNPGIGVHITNGAAISAGGGNITVNGRGRLSGSSNFGVALDAGSLSTTGAGVIMVRGIGGMTGNANYGVTLRGGSTITGGSSGATTVIGTGGTGTGTNNSGVHLNAGASPSRITSTGGNLTVTGTGGGSGTSNPNWGVYSDGSQIAVTAGSGALNVSGVGGLGAMSHGIYLLNAAEISSTGGAVTVTGQAGTSGGVDLNLDHATASPRIRNTGNGSVTLNTDSVNIEIVSGSTASISAGTGTLTIANRTANTRVNLGGSEADVAGADGTRLLSISSAEYGRLTAGTLVIGASNSGNLTVSSALTMGSGLSTLTLNSGSNLTVNTSSPIGKTGANNSTLNLLARNNVVVHSGITASTGLLNVNVEANTDATGGGGVTFNAAVATNGGNLRVVATNTTNGANSASNINFNSGANVTAGTGHVFLWAPYNTTINSNITAGNITIGNTAGVDAALGQFNPTGGNNWAGSTAISLGSISLMASNNIFMGGVTTTTNPSAVDLGNATVNATGELRIYGATSSGQPQAQGIQQNTASLTSGGAMELRAVANSAAAWGNGASGGTYLSAGGSIDATGGLTLDLTSGNPSFYLGTVKGGTLTKSGTGTLALTGANTYGATHVAGGTLQISDGGSLGTGAVSLSNNATLSFQRSTHTTLDRAVSGTGSLRANIVSGNLTVEQAINLNGGTVDLVAGGDVNLNQSITTSNATANAIRLVAGRSLAAGNATGGNVRVGAGGSIQLTALGGMAALYTGSVAGTTGISGMAASGSGKFRYNSDEITTSFSRALDVRSATSNGVNIIYREAPTIQLTANSTLSGLTYNGLVQTGNQGVTETTAAGTLQNGDDSPQLTGTLTYTYHNNGVVTAPRNAGLYTVTPSGQSSALGYRINYLPGNLRIDKASLALSLVSQTKTYDGNDLAVIRAGDITATGISVGGNTETVSFRAVNGRYNSQNVTQANAVSVTVSASDVDTATAAHGLNLNNYTFSDAVAGQSLSSSGTITPREVTLTSITAASKTYDGSRSASISASISGTVGTETLLVSGSATFADRNVGSGKTVTVENVADLTRTNGTGDWANYRLITSGSQTTTADIVRREVLLTAPHVRKTYDGTAEYTVLPTDLQALSGQLVGGDSVTAATIRYADKNAGAGNKTVTLDSVSLSDGNGGANYRLTLAGNSISTIDRAALTVAATQASKTYDGNTSATGSGTVGALVPGDRVDSAGSQAFLDKDAGTGKTVRASGVLIKDGAGQDMTANYLITYVDNPTGAIDKANLTVTANDDAQFVTRPDVQGYNGVRYSGLVGGEDASVLGGSLTITRTNATTTGAGEYTGVLVPSGLTSNNYNISFAAGNYTIVPADRLLIRTINSSVAYGQTPVYDTTAQYLDSASNTISTLSRNGNAGNYTFTDGAGGSVSVALGPYSGGAAAALSGAGRVLVGNYDIRDAAPAVTGSNFVGPPVFVGHLAVRTLGITPTFAGVSKTYDGSTQMSNLALSPDSGKLAGDCLMLSGTGQYAQKNVGSQLAYTISDLRLAGEDAGNYHLQVIPGQLTGNDGVITRARLVITSADVVKTYDGGTGAAGLAKAAEGTRLWGADSLSGGSFAFMDRHAGTGKTVMVSGVTVNDGHGGNNYDVTYLNNTSSTITPRELTLSAVSETRTYDGTSHSTGVVAVSGLLGNDRVTGVSQAFDSKNAGSRTLIVNNGYTVDDGNGGNNYTVLKQTAGGTISQNTTARVVLTAHSASRTYNADTQSVSGFAVSGLLGEDAADPQAATLGITAGASGRNAGTYASTFSGSNAQLLANYANVSQNEGVLTVDRAALTLSAVNDSKAYDGTRSSGRSVMVSGLQGDDTVTGAIQSFDNRNAGSRTLAVYSGYTVNDGNGGNNYTVSTQTASGTINQNTTARVVLTAHSASRTYNADTQSVSGFAVTGLLGEDAADPQAATLGITAGASGRNAGTYASTFSGSNAQLLANYANVSQNEGVLTVDRARLTLAAVAESRTYDGTSHSVGGVVVTGLLGDDTVTGASQSFDSRNAGTRTLVVNSGYTVNDGNGGRNYTVITPTASGMIAPRLVGLSASKTYDGSTGLMGSQLSITTGVGNETLGHSGAVLNSKNVVGNDSNFVRALTLQDGANGGLAANYTVDLSGRNANNSAVILPRAIAVVGSVAQDKPYDGNTQATVVPGTLSNLVAGEALGVSASGQFEDAEAGANKAVMASYRLADGVNGLASNYVLINPTEVLRATILAATRSPLTPVVTPSAAPAPARVVIAASSAGSGTGSSTGSGASSGTGTSSAAALTRPGDKPVENRQGCSIANPESCECSPSRISGVEVCVAPSVQNPIRKD